ncbi:restriction endonuclease FokI C-terminal domain-containing protein [uncultured Eubacterium sp.]|uniref:restriction endonuclease FokI C-terminal domain-containing protein n=1 Tax=uncultured Eubacterium sp. TaxID=165185 RepID=UPI00258DE3BB|nr:restriction endonuclease FokI C-terminal domain-containing protein [uncultured Eubacterium sp.]
MRRTFGWVQNPNVLKTLKNVVASIVVDSEFNKHLRKNKLPLLLKNELILEEDYKEFMSLLENPQNGIAYEKLKGKGGERGLNSKGLPNSKCTGITQASIEAQKTIKLIDTQNNTIEIKKPYSDDWTADGYVRWAISTGLFDYDAKTDLVTVSALGKTLVESIEDSDEEKVAFTTALLSYPPANRVLSILSDGKKYTKFEIGERLGFSGEMGFTSIPQNLFIAELCSTSSPSEKTKIRSNEEGDSDKYARTIARWLEQMGWVITCKKRVNEKYMGINYGEDLLAYQITIQGQRALKLSKGYSSNPRIPKIVYFEMLASKAPDADYLRNKRAKIIQCLNGKKNKTFVEIQTFLKEQGVDVSCDTIKDDIYGLERIGLSFDISETSVSLNDTIIKLSIPEEKFETLEISKMKDIIRTRLHNLNHKYLILVDLAYSDASTKAKKNADAREFEIETNSLFTEELNFIGQRLGDSGKPDVIISHGKNGTIIDNKSYKNGFNVDAHCSDEMTRYILQNKNRKPGEPSNEWWKSFPDNVTDFTYLFITSYLKGKFTDNLQSIHANTGVNGGAIAVNNLLYLAEDMKSGKMPYENFFSMMKNCELSA